MLASDWHRYTSGASTKTGTDSTTGNTTPHAPQARSPPVVDERTAIDRGQRRDDEAREEAASLVIGQLSPPRPTSPPTVRLALTPAQRECRTRERSPVPADSFLARPSAGSGPAIIRELEP